VRADNPAALAFYTRLGFAHTSTMPLLPGRIDALRLVKPLAALEPAEARAAADGLHPVDEDKQAEPDHVDECQYQATASKAK